MKITTCKNETEFIKKALESITQILKTNKKIYNIALSGGSTPIPVYQALASLALPFAKIHFYQTDERFVPPTHKDSNQKLIKEAFKKLPPPNFHFFNTALPIAASLKEYKKSLPAQFDLTILGIGPDGHIASLFPHEKALTSQSHTAHTTTQEFAIKDRLTLTFAPILTSKKILVLLKGPEKEAVLKKLQSPQSLTIQNFPAKKLLSHPNVESIFSL